MPRLSQPDPGQESGVRDELGARDELIRFKDEGDQEKRSGATDQDLDDVKSSLVNESETLSSAESEVDRRRRHDPGARTRTRQMFEEGLRRQQELHFPPYLGYPFFMFPDLNLCSPYLAGGTHPYLPFQWPLLDLPARASLRDPSVHTHQARLPGSQTSYQHSGSVPVLPPHMSLRPLLSFSPEAPGLSPEAALPRPPGSPHFPASDGRPQIPSPLGWLSGRSIYPLSGGLSPAAVAMSASSLVSGGFSPAMLSPPSPMSPSHLPMNLKVNPESIGAQPSTSPAPSKQHHIKKPLNAFMLFMRDQRPHVVAECSVKESATINQILGQRWHSLSKEEQSRYYDQARKERLLHSKLYPGWSARDNYGKKKKRKRQKGDTADPAAEGCPPQVKRPLSGSGVDWSPTYSEGSETRHPAPSHLTHTHLSQSSPASSLESPATPTASLASPAAPAPTQTDHQHTGQYERPLSLTGTLVRASSPHSLPRNPPANQV